MHIAAKLPCHVTASFLQMKNSHSLSLVAVIFLLSFTVCENLNPKPRILVFSKTEGFRHASIQSGKAAIQEIAARQGYLADFSEDAGYFNDASLKKYAAVIFLNTTGNILNSSQQSSFQRFIQSGGGFAGIHSAADTEYDWAWYGKLVGAYFLSHPRIQNATIHVADKHHASTAHLPRPWKRKDEWYNYKNFYPRLNVLLKLDESSYSGGKNGSNHPIAWYHDYDGGRAFYTGLGHTNESYQDPLFLKHLAGGIKYAVGK